MVQDVVFRFPYTGRNEENELTVHTRTVFRFSHSVLNAAHETQHSRKFVFRTPRFYFRIDDVHGKCDTHFVFVFRVRQECEKRYGKPCVDFRTAYGKRKTAVFRFPDFVQLEKNELTVHTRTPIRLNSFWLSLSYWISQNVL